MDCQYTGEELAAIARAYKHLATGCDRALRVRSLPAEEVAGLRIISRAAWKLARQPRLSLVQSPS